MMSPAATPLVMARVWGREAGARVAAFLDAEQGRWFLWLPVFFGAGIAAYFALPHEPAGIAAVALVLAALAGRIFLRASLWGLILSSIVLASVSGFAAAKLRTWAVAAPQIERQGVHEVTGFVESHERRSAKRWRAVIRVHALERDGQRLRKPPRKLRILVHGDAPPAVGGAMKVRAMLFPPPQPMSPGGYDFGRADYFRGIGGSGYAVAKFEPVAGLEQSLALRLRTSLVRLRLEMVERIQSVLPGQTGAIAAALTVGMRGDLSGETLAAMRVSGLAHVLAISGLHMTLVAGTLYWALRWLLALFPAIALRWNIRALAAAAALGFATVYLALSGAALATQRAYLMVAVVFLAIMLNRPALSLRNVALAALAILALMPESLLDASFQMSFAATAALVAGYERLGRRLNVPANGVVARLLLLPFVFAAGTLLTTIIASTATAPFSAYHFHNGATYAALGNLLAMPVVTLIVMPMAILALAAMPLALEGAPLQAMGFGIGLMTAIADWVASLDGAWVTIPSFPVFAFALMVAGGLWIIIWRQRARYLGLIAIALGLLATPGQPRPDVLTDREGKIVAVRGPDGQLSAPKTRKAMSVLEAWLKADGDSRKAKDAATGRGFQCDLTACLAMVKGRLVSHVLQPEAFAQDCRRADIVITALEAPQGCRAPLVLDKWALWQKGAHALIIAGNGIEVRSAAEGRGLRPWAPARNRRDLIEPYAAPQDEAQTGPAAVTE
jgi:competence protein ComEC